jgi:hypothetical protein
METDRRKDRRFVEMFESEYENKSLMFKKKNVKEIAEKIIAHGRIHLHFPKHRFHGAAASGVRAGRVGGVKRGDFPEIR